MSHRAKRKYLILLGILFIAGGGGVFLSFGPPQLMAKTETPLFCSSCHVMQSEFEAWFNVGAHRTIRCVDCHLPHQNLPVYYFWKSVDGLKDVMVYYSGTTPETITISKKQEKVVQVNCIRCHTSRVERIDPNRNCWECHRWLQHHRAGVRLTS
ncbi:MAG: NapC/NirT family cytochrome c [Thermodesulfobacteriota bacterium]